jgi:rhodanese-related sulfurtransferase
VAAGRLSRGDELEPDLTVLDVRQEAEFTAGHVPGAVNVELGALAVRLEDVPSGPLLVMCGHGERAMGAASILERAGHGDVRVLDGGPKEWAAATGRGLEALS